MSDITRAHIGQNEGNKPGTVIQPDKPGHAEGPSRPNTGPDIVPHLPEEGGRRSGSTNAPQTNK